MTLREFSQNAPAERGVRGLVDRPFVVAVVLLVVAALLSQGGTMLFNIRQGKEALPLRAALSELRESTIAPYRVVHRAVLDPATVEALGTQQYINWTLEDTSVSPNDPLRVANLFVTYYTGGHTLVPHTPDVCYVGGGYATSQLPENLEIEVPGLRDGSSVPVRVCTFQKTAVFGNSEVSVVYTFNCNGRFVATREGVRVLINDLFNRYAYFSKVEVSFERASRSQSLEGARKLFERALPALVDRHWPNFAEAESLAAARQKAGEQR